MKEEIIKKVSIGIVTVIMALFLMDSYVYAVTIQQNDYKVGIFTKGSLQWINWNEMEDILKLRLNNIDGIYIKSKDISIYDFPLIYQMIDNDITVIVETNGNKRDITDIIGFFAKEVNTIDMEFSVIDGIELSRNNGVININFIEYAVAEKVNENEITENLLIDKGETEGQRKEELCKEKTLVEDIENILISEENNQCDAREMVREQERETLQLQFVDLPYYKYFSGKTVYICDSNKLTIGSIRIQHYIYRAGTTNNGKSMVEDVMSKVTATSFNNRYIRQFLVDMEIPKCSGSTICDYVSFKEGNRETLTVGDGISINTEGGFGVTGSASTTVTYTLGSMYAYAEYGKKNGVNDYSKVNWIFTTRTSDPKVDYNSSKQVTPGIRVMNGATSSKKETTTVSNIYFGTKTNAYYMCTSPIIGICNWK